MSEFYYTSGDQQLGPVTAAQLKHLAATGQIQVTDMIWKEGMPEWIPVTKVKGLFPSAAAAPLPAATLATAVATPAQPQPHQPAGPRDVFPAADQPAAVDAAPPAPVRPSDLGDRVARAFKGYPSPNGPHVEWPMTDHQLYELQKTERHRKFIRNASTLYRVLFVFSVISIAYVLYTLLIVTAYSNGTTVRLDRLREMSAYEQVAFWGWIGFHAGQAVLCLITARATIKCRPWAPIVMLCFFGLTAALLVLQIYLAVAAHRPGEVPILAVLLAFPSLFIYFCVRALTSMPRFLRSPVWAQEALIQARL